jgi:hypothetical protein
VTSRIAVDVPRFRDGCGGRSRRLLLASVIAVTIAACASGAAPASPTLTPAPTRTPTPSATPLRTPDAFDLLVARAADGDDPSGSELDELWRAVMSAVPADRHDAYRPPERVVGYSTGAIPESPCAEDTPASFWRQNAFYCRADQSILYDEAWLRDFAERFGPFAPVAILAHEWGHHVQDLLRVRGYSIQTELQADCLAGLYLANTAEDVVDPSMGAAELASSLAAFFDLGNREYEASDWFQAAEHGSSVQRMMAFGTGFLSSVDMPQYEPPVGQGLAWCYGYRDYVPADFVDIGPYRLLKPPGRAAEQRGEGHVLSAEARLGYETSTVEVAWLADFTTEQLEQRFPGLVLLSEQIPLHREVAEADGFAHFFEQPAGPGTDERNGIIALIVPRSGEGRLVILAYRDGPAPTDETPDGLARVAESLMAVYQIVNRLCSPSETDDPGKSNFNVTCMAVQ